MKKKGLAVVVVIAVLCLCVYGVSGGSDEKIESLEGSWEEEYAWDEYQAGYITGDSITIWWITEGEDDEVTASLYWAGTYEAPEEATDSWSWESVNDTEQTGAALLASDAETLTFTYEDGVLSYSVTALGSTETCELVMTDTDYSIYAENAGPEEDGEDETESETQDSGDAGEEEDSGSSSSRVTLETDTKDLYYEDGIQIRIAALSFYEEDRMEVELVIRNTSYDNITILAQNGTVNGYMMDYHFYRDFESKSMEIVDMFVYKSDLELAGIETVTEFGFSFHITDADTGDTIVDTEQYTLKTSAYGTAEQTYDDSGTVLYDAKEVRIISKGLTTDDSGTQLILYIENNSSEDITIQMGDTTVDGSAVDPGFSVDILPGMRVVSTADLGSLEESGITDVSSISTCFTICERESLAAIVETGTLTLSF